MKTLNYYLRKNDIFKFEFFLILRQITQRLLSKDMEVANPKALQLCNCEVLSLLKEIKGKQKKNSQSQLATITYETIKYLEDKPCANQTGESVQNYLKSILQNQIQLSKAEKLMLVNNPPTTPLEIQLVVEESEERLSDEQVDSLLQITNEAFGEKTSESAEQ